MAKSFTRIVLLSLFFYVAGCSYLPPRVHPPEIDADEAAEQAIKLYDQDDDGRLSTQELAACPGILQRVGQYDSDQDSYLTAVEIAERIRPWYTGNLGMISLRCLVLLDGRPLRGAEVILEPESFLQPAVKPARSIAEENGLYILRIAPEDLPRNQQSIGGAHLGIYKARVTHPQKELPPEFHSETQYGVEVTAADQVGGILLNLESP